MSVSTLRWRTQFFCSTVGGGGRTESRSLGGPFPCLGVFWIVALSLITYPWNPLVFKIRNKGGISSSMSSLKNRIPFWSKASTTRGYFTDNMGCHRWLDINDPGFQSGLPICKRYDLHFPWKGPHHAQSSFFHIGSDFAPSLPQSAPMLL